MRNQRIAGFKWRPFEPDEPMSPEDAFFPLQSWGEISHEIQHHLSHLHGKMVRVPEGLLGRFSCNECGAHQERVLDFRTVAARLERHGINALSGDLIDDVFQKMIRKHWQPVTERWAPRHAGCPDEPREHQLPEKSRPFLGELLTWAQQELKLGGSVPGRLYVLFEDRTWTYLRFDDLPVRQSSEDLRRTVVREARKQQFRDWRDRHDLTLQAAFFLSEAWIREGTLGEGVDTSPVWKDPRREETLVVWVGTSEFGRLATPPIRRQPDGSVEVEAVGELSFASARSTISLLEGLFAPSISASEQ